MTRPGRLVLWTVIIVAGWFAVAVAIGPLWHRLTDDKNDEEDED